MYGSTTFGTQVDVEEGIVPEIGDRGSGGATLLATWPEAPTRRLS